VLLIDLSMSVMGIYRQLRLVRQATHEDATVEVD
jgi:hypothetical protein